MTSEERCRRCGAALRPSDRFCGDCGTLQRPTRTPQSPPGWHRDPFGRAQFRFWDGEIWTDAVYSGEYRRDVLSLDNAARASGPDGPWRASFGSLAFSAVGLVIAFGLSFVFILPFLLTGRPGGVVVGLLLSEAGLWTGLFGTCLLTSHRYGSGSFAVDFHLRFRWVDVGIGLVAAVVARCVAALVLVPFIRVSREAGNPDQSVESITHLGGLGWFALVALTCIGAPFFEELYFRGLLQGQLVERIGSAPAIGLTAVIFGAVHILNDPGVAGLLLGLTVGASGVVLGVVRRMTGRLGSSMATHALFNATAVIVLALVQAS